MAGGLPDRAGQPARQGHPARLKTRLGRITARLTDRIYQRQAYCTPIEFWDMEMVSVPPAPGPIMALNMELPLTDCLGAYM